MDEFVVDTNVPILAKGGSHMSSECELACAGFIELFLRGRQVLVIDDNFELISEYMRQISYSGPLNFANRFLKWILSNQNKPHRVKQVRVSSDNSRCDGFTLKALTDISFDPSDVKFVAVALANDCAAPIAQAADSKWIGWEETLNELGLQVMFLCKKELAEIYDKKMR